MKAMQRLIVTSATYRQTSRVTPKLVERDPQQSATARGPRIRLEAEMVRDQALAVSGLLSPKIGGPSVMPPQPDGIWSNPYSGDRWATISRRRPLSPRALHILAAHGPLSVSSRLRRSRAASFALPAGRERTRRCKR